MKTGRIAGSVIALAAFFLVGCSTDAGLVAGDDKAAISAQEASSAPVVGSLPEASIPMGACGMILWTLDQARPSAIFRQVAGKGAEINLDGAVASLDLVQADGRSESAVFDQQRFSAGEITVEVRVNFSQGFDGGSYVERGLVSIEKPDGWRTVIPAAGIVGCRAK